MTAAQKRVLWKLVAVALIAGVVIAWTHDVFVGAVLFVAFAVGYLVGFDDSNQADFDDW